MYVYKVDFHVVTVVLGLAFWVRIRLILDENDQSLFKYVQVIEFIFYYFSSLSEIRYELNSVFFSGNLISFQRVRNDKCRYIHHICAKQLRMGSVCYVFPEPTCVPMSKYGTLGAYSCNSGTHSSRTFWKLAGLTTEKQMRKTSVIG